MFISAVCRLFCLLSTKVFLLGFESTFFFRKKVYDDTVLLC